MPVLQPSDRSEHCDVEFEHQLSIYPTTEGNHKKILIELAGRRTILTTAVQSELYKNPQFLRHREHSVSIGKAKRLMLFREKTDCYYDCHQKNT